jgi:DNA-binding PadR family transcriptional regulator
MALNSTAACILGLLDIGPPPPGRERWSIDQTISSADLWNALEQSVGGFWSMTRSQVYQELRRLTDARLVDVSEKNRYAVTQAGRDAAHEWFNGFALAEPRDEQIRSPIALSVFFGHYLDADLLERVVREHELRFKRRLQRLRSIDQAMPADRSLPGSTLRRAILYLDGAIEWTHDVLDRLRTPSAPAREKARRRETH